MQLYAGLSVSWNMTYRAAEIMPGLRQIQLAILEATVALIILGAVVWVGPHLHLAELHDKGELTTGKVTYKLEGISYSGAKTQRAQVTYSLDYQYIVSGTAYNDVEAVSYAYFSAARIGDPITIYVLPNNPAYHSVGPTTAKMVRTDTVAPAFIGIVLLTIAALYILGLEASARKNLRRLRTWEEAVGTVVRIPKSGMVVLKCNFNEDNEEQQLIRFVSTVDLSIDSEVDLLYNPKNKLKVILFDELKYVRLLDP